MSNRTLSIIALVCMLSFGFVWHLKSLHESVPPQTLTPCVTEDDDNCFWDADMQGNGWGTSFVRINGNTIYLRK